MSSPEGGAPANGTSVGSVHAAAPMGKKKAKVAEAVDATPDDGDEEDEKEPWRRRGPGRPKAINLNEFDDLDRPNPFSFTTRIF